MQHKTTPKIGVQSMYVHNVPYNAASMLQNIKTWHIITTIIVCSNEQHILFKSSALPGPSKYAWLNQQMHATGCCTVHRSTTEHDFKYHRHKQPVSRWTHSCDQSQVHSLHAHHANNTTTHVQYLQSTLVHKDQTKGQDHICSLVVVHKSLINGNNNHIPPPLKCFRWFTNTVDKATNSRQSQA